MRARRVTAATTASAIVALLAVWQGAPTGQAPARGAARPPASPLPRTPDGQPDLQGTYDIATLTPLERPAALGDQLTMTDEQARRLESAVAARRARASAPSSADRPAPRATSAGTTTSGSTRATRT